MYTMDRDAPPKRPVISSLTGAITEVRRWLKENQFDQVRDGDGLPWDLSVKTHQEPDPRNPKGLIWELRLCLEAKVSGPRLVETATFDRVKDARLVEMIGSDIIELKMKPLVYKAASEDAAKAMLVEMLPKLKASFARSSLSEVKRSLVGRFIDDRCRFGGGPV